MESIGSDFPDDIILVVAKYWLKNNRYATITLRKATARLLAQKHDYDTLNKLYIQKLDLGRYNNLLEEIPKVHVTESSCSVQLCTPTSLYPVYVIKYESTIHANIWMLHWLERNNSGVRRYGRHSPTRTFFLTHDNKWIE